MVSRGDATYDKNGNELTNIVKYFNSQEQKWIKSKNEYTYNDQNLTTSATSYGSVPEDQEFVPSFRTIYDYNANGDMTLRQSEDYNATNGKYTASSKEVWTYDSNGNMLTLTSSFKDYATNELKEVSKNENTYDQRDNLIQNLFYNKDSEDKWQLSQKAEYTYNSMDSVLTKTTYSNPFGSTELSPETQWQYTYNEKGNRLTWTSLYMGENGKWVNMAREENTYNTDSKMTAQYKYNWNMGADGDGEWQITFKGTYGYDEGLRQTAIEERRYDAMQGVWIGLQKSETEYDEYGNILKETVYQWVESSSEFILSGTITYYYSTTSGINQNVSLIKEYKVNQENGIVSVEVDGTPVSFTAYTITGQKICSDVYSLPTSKGKAYIIVAEGKFAYKVLGR